MYPNNHKYQHDRQQEPQASARAVSPSSGCSPILATPPRAARLGRSARPGPWMTPSKVVWNSVKAAAVNATASGNFDSQTGLLTGMVRLGSFAGRVSQRGCGRTLGPVRYFRSIIRHFRVVTSPIFSTIASALSPILMSPTLLSSLFRRTLAWPMGKVQSLAWSVKVTSFLSAS
jgi:hypothetical protein